MVSPPLYGANYTEIISTQKNKRKAVVASVTLPHTHSCAVSRYLLGNHETRHRSTTQQNQKHTYHIFLRSQAVTPSHSLHNFFLQIPRHLPQTFLLTPNLATFSYLYSILFPLLLLQPL